MTPNTLVIRFSLLEQHQKNILGTAAQNDPLLERLGPRTTEKRQELCQTILNSWLDTYPNNESSAFTQTIMFKDPLQLRDFFKIWGLEGERKTAQDFYWILIKDESHIATVMGEISSGDYGLTSDSYSFICKNLIVIRKSDFQNDTESAFKMKTEDGSNVLWV